MDGTSRTVLHNTGLSNPYGLTIDYENQILYWIDDGYNRIESSYVNGTGRVVLTTSSIEYPHDIAYFEGNVYWTDQYYDGILSASVDPVTVANVSSSISNPYGISVFSEEGQPEGMYLGVAILFEGDKGEKLWIQRRDYVHLNLDLTLDEPRVR